MKPTRMVLFLVFCCVGAVSEDMSYYVWDGQALTTAKGNPESVNADHWAVWMYKKDKPQEESFHWGTDDGDSAQKVVDTLKRNQAFESRYEKWCGCDWGDDTFNNAKGPIAILKSLPTQFTDSETDVNQKDDDLETILEAWMDARELAGADETKSEIREVLDGLKDALDRVNTARKDMSALTSPSIDFINQSLSSIDKDLKQVRETSAVSTIWQHEEVHVPKGTVVQDVASGGNSYTIVFKVEYASGTVRTVTVEIPFSAIGSISDVQDSRVYAGYWSVFIVGKRDASSGLLTDFSETEDSNGKKQPNSANTIELDFPSEALAKAARLFLASKLQSK